MDKHCDDWVEVRSKEEILATLDKNGLLDGMPFMPQMFEYCGQRFQIYKRAHKTCDTVSGRYTGRSIPRAVHLEHRCDGRAYGGCQAACLIFWKEAWLKPAEGRIGDLPGGTLNDQPIELTKKVNCTEDDVYRGTYIQSQPGDNEKRYTCQATELLTFTGPLKWWDARQYVEDYASGNASLGKMLRGLAYFAYYRGSFAKSRRFGRPARWLYDKVQSLRGGVPFPTYTGKLKSGKDAPICDLDLQPGDLVRVKPYEQILATVDTGNMNRGLSFDREMVPYCGGTYRVRARVEKFIDEKTGKMKRLKTPAIILEGVFCQSRYSPERLFCPRSIYTWWREVWLERVSPAEGNIEKATRIRIIEDDRVL
jgi:hypothetical protein